MLLRLVLGVEHSSLRDRQRLVCRALEATGWFCCELMVQQFMMPQQSLADLGSCAGTTRSTYR
jgi:hypothetical protein